MELPVTLRSSRRKLALYLLGSLAGVAAAYWMLQEQPVTAWLCIVFCGLCSLVFFVQLIPNSSYLRLTAEGFTMCSLFRRQSIEWRYVGNFGIARIGLKKLVGWDPAHAISGAGKVTKAISGYVSALPDTYGLAAEDLAELMNRARDQATLHENI